MMKAGIATWGVCGVGLLACAAAQSVVPEAAARVLGAVAGLLALIGGTAGGIGFCGFAKRRAT